MGITKATINRRFYQRMKEEGYTDEEIRKQLPNGDRIIRDSKKSPEECHFGFFFRMIDKLIRRNK